MAQSGDDEESDEEGDDDDDEGDEEDEESDDEEGEDEEGDEESASSSGDEEERLADPEGPFPGQDRFFFERPRVVGEAKKTRVSGSLTSTSFLYREFGVLLPDAEAAEADDAGPQGTAQRLVTDLRAQLSAKDFGGGSYSFRGDLRGRFVPGACKVNDKELDSGNPCRRLQSGSFSGNELHIAELYISRHPGKLRVDVGRMFVLELAAHRLDGAAIRLKRSKKATFIGFVGLHPQRGSRDVRQDYPKSAVQSDMGTKRLLPITGGGGLAYRLESLYGALGAVAIAPLAEARERPLEPGQLEDPRIFLTSNGYFRVGPRLDLYHYLVFDALGSAQGALTNLTLGVNARPSPRLRANLSVSRVDTETLTALAETKLEDPAPNGNVIQNNVEVLRIAQDAVRAGVSGSFDRRRFELSTSLALRQRPETTLTAPVAMDPVTLVLPASRDIDAMVSFVDRRSFGGFRLGGSVSRSFGLGDDRFQRATTLSVRGTARKTIAQGKGEVDGYLSFIQSDSAANFTPAMPGMLASCNTLAATDLNQFEACFAGTSTIAVTAGVTAFYRLGNRLMAIGSGSVGTLAVSTDSAITGEQGAITPVTLFLRLAYRL